MIWIFASLGILGSGISFIVGHVHGHRCEKQAEREAIRRMLAEAPPLHIGRRGGASKWN